MFYTKWLVSSNFITQYLLVDDDVHRQFASPGCIKNEFDLAMKRLNSSRQEEEGLHEEANIALSRHILLQNSLEGDSLDSEPSVRFLFILFH